MTNPTPHGQVPEALRLAEEISNLVCSSEAAASPTPQALSAAPEAIAKLRHLYQNMVNGAVRDTASAKRIAEGLLAPAIEALERATPPAEQQAQPGVVYAELPEPDATTVGLGAVWNRRSMRDFADRTHALRASQGQAPAAPKGDIDE